MTINEFDKHYSINEDAITANIKMGTIFRFFKETTIAPAGLYYLYAKVPLGRKVGVISSALVAGGSPSKMTVYGGAITHNVSGDVVPVFNLNLSSQNTSDMIVEAGGALDVDISSATKFDIFYAPAGQDSGINKSGTGIEVDRKVMTIIPQLTEFVLEFENLGTDSSDILIKYSWIETTST